MTKTKAQAVLLQNQDWQAAAQDACEQLKDFGPVDLLVLFASEAYGDNLTGLVQTLYKEIGPNILIGCSGGGIIGPERELEDVYAISVLALSLPGAELKPYHFSQSDLMKTDSDWLSSLIQKNGGLQRINAWMLLGHPFTIRDAEQMLTVFSQACPGRPLIGGLASGDFQLRRQAYLFLNDQVIQEGALGLAVGGEYTLRPVVSQGATPIGEAWMVTAAEGNVIQSISGRTAYEVLIETFKSLTPTQQQQARRNLLVGLAVDEYKAEFNRGDFIIRSLMGIDPNSGIMAINDEPRLGQTIQFQLRDAAAADEDLREILGAAKTALGQTEPVAGLLFSCNGRGTGLFGEPDHDARLVAEQLGAMPLAGFFCAGEIGPVGPKNFLHGFTASLGLFVPMS